MSTIEHHPTLFYKTCFTMLDDVGRCFTKFDFCQTLDVKHCINISFVPNFDEQCLVCLESL